MLVNLQEVLSYAEQKQCAVGAFNTPNFVMYNGSYK